MPEFLSQYALHHPILAAVFFVALRTLAVIIPPVSGVVVDIAGILMFGWKTGFIYGQASAMLGSTIAFFIARKFREPLIQKFVALQKLNAWEDKYSEKQKFWVLVAVRLVTAPFFDYINYAAGLTKINATKYLLSTFIGSVPIYFSIYYFGGFFLLKNLFFAFIFVLSISILGTLIKKWDIKHYIKKVVKND